VSWSKKRKSAFPVDEKECRRPARNGLCYQECQNHFFSGCGRAGDRPGLVGLIAADAAVDINSLWVRNFFQANAQAGCAESQSGS
jgi:hypothetical protein